MEKEKVKKDRKGIKGFFGGLATGVAATLGTLIGIALYKTNVYSAGYADGVKDMANDAVKIKDEEIKEEGK